MFILFLQPCIIISILWTVVVYNKQLLCIVAGHVPEFGISVSAMMQTIYKILQLYNARWCLFLVLLVMMMNPTSSWTMRRTVSWPGGRWWRRKRSCCSSSRQVYLLAGPCARWSKLPRPDSAVMIKIKNCLAFWKQVCHCYSLGPKIVDALVMGLDRHLFRFIIAKVSTILGEGVHQW